MLVNTELRLYYVVFNSTQMTSWLRYQIMDILGMTIGFSHFLEDVLVVT